MGRESLDIPKFGRESLDMGRNFFFSKIVKNFYVNLLILSNTVKTLVFLVLIQKKLPFNLSRLGVMKS